MSWKVDKIKQVISDLQREETRQFTVVYGALPEKYWGYLSAYPQSTKVWFTDLSEDETKALKEEYGAGFFVLKDKNTKKAIGYYYKASIPYLGVDGCLQMMHDDNADVNGEGMKKVILNTEPVTINNIACIKATVVCSKGKSEAVVAIDKSNNVEKAVSSALRRALTFLGYGRFPLDKTKYKDHPQIVKYREFLKNEADKPSTTA